ncbi:hypothetical protein [Thalassospira xiamenensis]|uniref:Uncharacterized protein YaaW, UPF0174 family n=1 Tax=Thalassospira xiamenensis TaxID=220697 RepID=A0A285RTF6_9PROT|nr:hypothetical protein [Thalassospira xiamenensis]SOB95652.1 Uncharacterized protein YaaW, UPF0174 family [Thalassospira xiamenensis]
MNNNIRNITNGDLYTLLALCTAEDLNPLAETILKRSTNSLSSNKHYKIFNPDHTKYHKVIGDEIRQFGGKSIRNLFRESEKPPYDKIVVDVCKKLRVPFKLGNTPQNETNLLDLFMTFKWDNLSSEERNILSQKASQNALGKIENPSTFINDATDFALSRIVGGNSHGRSSLTVRALLLGTRAFDPVFKITIPCVLHIAYLRRKILEELITTQNVSSSLTLPPPLKPMTGSQSPALVIAEENNVPLISLTRVPEPSNLTAWHDIGSFDSGISRLNPLLQSVPAMIIAGEVANTNYMEVITNGDALLKTKDGILKAITVGSDGKFSGIAEVVTPSTLASIVNVTALLNLASIVLAQKHLADISKKLGEIKKAIEDIWQHLRNERHSKITGSIRYFEQISASILEGELSDRVLHQIERHEADLLQVQDHIERDIQAKLEELRNLKNDEWFGSSETTLSIEKRQQELGDLYREAILCIRARSCGWQLLSIFPGEERSKAHRRQDIQKSLEALSPRGPLLTETDCLFRTKIHNLSSKWNKDITINQRKLTLLKRNDTLIADVAFCRSEVQKDIHAADKMLADMRKPVAMTVKIDNGQIVAVRAL